MGQRIKRQLAALVLAVGLTVATLPSSGCYGQMALSGKIYRWNGTIGNKWVRSLVFFGFIVIPVYELSMLGDWLIFNTIEFWLGSNPIGGSAAVETRQLADGSVQLKCRGRDYRIVPTSAKSFTIVKDGEKVGEGHLAADGRLLLQGTDPQQTQVIEEHELEALRETFASRNLRVGARL